MKHIIVCSDGTGNTEIKGRGTNVFKTFESIDLNSHRYHPERVPQVAIYDDGVGTEAFKPLKLLGGAFGYGLSRNVRQLYKELCRIYDPDDRIFLFGFSRGAFTVRTLAGLIATCGILKLDQLTDSVALERRVARAYKLYRRRYRTWLMRRVAGEPDLAPLQKFKSEHCHGNEKIAFIGVWDTVDAVGLPLPIADAVNSYVHQFKFPNHTLSPSVERAHHALAIDDEREAFHPLLWDEHGLDRSHGQVLEQVWFAGAHSNVGGGYPKQGMSLVALDWMMQRAEDAGLRLLSGERLGYRDHASVDDKLYDPRTGLGAAYSWLPRDIARMCSARGIEPKLHISVLERAAHGTEDYAPGNLPPGASVVITPVGSEQQDAAAEERARGLAAVLRESMSDGESLLSKVKRDVRIAHTVHQVALLAFIVLVASWTALALRVPFVNAGSRTGGAVLRDAAHGFVLWVGQVASEPLRGVLPLLVFALSWALVARSHHRQRLAFSLFWFKHQQRLREALKRTRAASLAPPAPSAPSVSGWATHADERERESA